MFNTNNNQQHHEEEDTTITNNNNITTSTCSTSEPLKNQGSEESTTKKALKKSSLLLTDLNECNEVQLLNLFDQAEHFENIILMLKVLNRLIEFKNVYFYFIHLVINIY